MERKKAPLCMVSFSENCVFGDYGGLLVQKTVTCAQLIATKPRMCYQEDNRQLCCGSCAKARNSAKPGKFTLNHV